MKEVWEKRGVAMETISVKQEPVDDGYGQALTTYGCGGESREEYPGNKSSKPIGKSKLLKLLFSQDVPPSFDDDTCNSVTLSSANDKNGSSVRMKTVANQEYEKTTRNGSSIRIKTEVVDPEYEETTRSESSVKIKTEVVDPEYEGTTREELVNMSASNGSHSKLFSLLSTAPDSNHRNQNTVGNLHTSHKNLSSLLSRPSMSHMENLSFTGRNAELKANNSDSKNCSTLLKMLASPGMPNYSHCNGASHVTPKSQLQDTAAKSSSLTSSNANVNAFSKSPDIPSQGNSPSHVMQRSQPLNSAAKSSSLTSANSNLNAFDTTLRAMLEKPVPKNTSNKGLIELLNKDVGKKNSASPKPETASRQARTVRNRLDATINMLMNKSESKANLTNEKATNNYPTNGKNSKNHPTNSKVANEFPTNCESSLMSGDMQSYNQWIEQMSSFLTKQVTQSKQGITVQGSSSFGYTASHGNQSMQSVPYHTEPDFENPRVQNVVLDKDGAMFVTVKPQHLDLSYKKRGQDKNQSVTEEEPEKKKQKKSFEYLKAELLKPATKKFDIQGLEVKVNPEDEKTELSKKNVKLSSLLGLNPNKKDQNPAHQNGFLNSAHKSKLDIQVSQSKKEPVLANGQKIKRELQENPNKCESEIRSILQLPVLNGTKNLSQKDSALREQLNAMTPNVSAGQGHYKSALKKCLKTETPNLSPSSQGCSKTKLNVQGQEKQTVMTPEFSEGQDHPESTVSKQNNFENQFPASSLMMQLSESVGGQGHTGVESRDRGQVYTGGQNSVPNQGLVEPPVVHKPGENPTFWIYRCKQCFKTFRHAGTLKVHERAHSYDREEFKCNICGKVCSAAGYLAIHMRTHFPEKAKENEGIFTCTLCRDTFSERENLLIHLRMHSGEKLFKCEVCHTGFTRKTQLFIHMRIHTGEKPYRCEFCNKTFRQSNGLNLHLTTHTEDKPYRCEICNKGFGRKAHYDKHMRKHRGERPFVCTECGKGFTDKFNLTMHTKIHNKEKDHICGICNKGYNQASHLKNHMKFHTGELGYRCVYCYKTTEFKRELYTHFKGDHPDLYQDYVTKQKKKRYYEILNPRFQDDTSLNRKLEDEEDSDVDEMMESDYESEAESGGDNFQFDEDVKPVINDIHTEYESETNTESQNMLTEIKQEL